MTFKDNQELRAMDEKGLRQEVSKAKTYLNSICFDHEQGNHKNTAEMQKVRKYIARMGTFLSERNNEVKTAPQEAATSK